MNVSLYIIYLTVNEIGTIVNIFMLLYFSASDVLPIAKELQNVNNVFENISSCCCWQKLHTVFSHKPVSMQGTGQNDEALSSLLSLLRSNSSANDSEVIYVPDLIVSTCWLLLNPTRNHRHTPLTHTHVLYIMRCYCSKFMFM